MTLFLVKRWNLKRGAHSRHEVIGAFTREAEAIAFCATQLFAQKGMYFDSRGWEWDRGTLDSLTTVELFRGSASLGSFPVRLNAAGDAVVKA